MTVLLAGGHRLFAEGLMALLEARDVRVVGIHADGDAAVQAAAEALPEVVIADTRLPDMSAVEFTGRILHASSSTRVICVSDQPKRQCVLGVLDAGAAGYVHMDCGVDVLVRAICTVVGGEVFLCPKAAGHMVTAYRKRGDERTGVSGLTPRERQIVLLVALGQTSKQIARALDIAVQTAKRHRENAMRKLDVHSASDLTRLAIREGLVEA